MSMQAINYALTLPVDDPGPRLTLLCIAFHISYRSGDMFVSQAELAKEVRVSDRSIRRYLITLEEAGFIKREKRWEDGHQETDRIELIGYLEWQAVLEHGGTIPNPATRGKPVENQPDKFSAIGEHGGQPGYSMADKKGGHGGQQVSDKPINQQRTTSAREGACVAGATPSRASGPSKPVVVRQPELGWTQTLDHLRQNGHRPLAERIEDARGYTATTRFWVPGQPLPAPLDPPPAAVLSAASKRMTGEDVT